MSFSASTEPLSKPKTSAGMDLLWRQRRALLRRRLDAPSCGRAGRSDSLPSDDAYGGVLAAKLITEIAAWLKTIAKDPI
jgi:hypothetical protein